MTDVVTWRCPNCHEPLDLMVHVHRCRVTPSAQEVKPCPFCAGRLWTMDKTLRDGYENEQDDPDAFAYNVRCNHCAATGGWAKSISGAIRLWNMRPEPQP